MEFKVDFKCSDSTMRADFGVVTELSESQKRAYEQQLEESESQIAGCRAEIDGYKTEIDGYKTEVEALEGRVEDYKTEVEECRSEIESLEGRISVAYNDGKKAEYDAFWDVYQRNGGRSDYSRAFAGAGWTEDTFDPKYNISPAISATRMFDTCYVKDLAKELRDRGITLSTSNTVRTDYMFSNAKTTTVPPLDIRKANINEYMFYRAESLKTIECLTISDDGSTVFGTRFFALCYALENITIDGKIGCDLDIRYSPLTKESIENIFWSLSSEASGIVYLSKENVDKRYETTEGANDGSISEEWYSLWLNRPMWYYQLV